MTNEKNIGKGFSRLSSSYLFLSRLFFGTSLTRSQFYFMDQIPGNSRILIAGVGTGELLVEVLNKKIAREIVCVDISEGMIQQTKKLLAARFPGNSIPVHFNCLPIQNYTSREKFDCIFFPYVLDCLQDKDLSITLSNAKQQLSAGGKIVVTDFQIPDKPFFVQLYTRILIRILYLFFRIVCKLEVKQLPDFTIFLSAQEFVLKKEKTFYLNILFTRMYSLQ